MAAAPGNSSPAATPTVPAPSLREATRLLDSLMAAPPLGRAHWGVAVYDAATGEALLERNADELFVPASNMKLVTVAAALALLGPDFRFTTTVAAPGLADGAAEALVVRGGGDPTISRAFFHTPLAPFDSLADSLSAAGLKRVDGPLIVDETRFDSTLVSPAWEAGDLRWYYAAPVTPLAVLEGAFPLLVVPGGAGGRARVSVLHEGSPVTLDASVTTSPGNAAWNDVVGWVGATDTLRVRGRIGAGARPDTSWLAQRDPGRWAGLALAASLARAGIDVAGPVIVRYGEPPFPDAPSLAVWRSPPLVHILPLPLAHSDNWIAEMILKTLGAEAGDGGTWSAGTAVAERFMAAEVGLDPGAMYMRDGSGLAAQDLVTPRALVSVLRYVRSTPWGAAFRAAMAAPGDTAGTLEHRLDGYGGRLVAKTGTITHVNALSGYLRTEGGRELVFSVLVNAAGRPASEVRRAVDRVVEALLRSGS